MNAKRLKEMPMRDCLLCRDDDDDQGLRGRNSNIILWWTVKHPSDGFFYSFYTEDNNFCRYGNF